VGHSQLLEVVDKLLRPPTAKRVDFSTDTPS
jgi:hypothetical protein